MTEPTQSDAASGGAAPTRVVVAEDEALIRMDLAEMLAEEGYDVVGRPPTARRRSRLAERASARPGDPRREDAVLDGIAAAEQIAEQRIAPVVMLTAFSQRELVERARDAGAMAYLVKPFTKADLVPAIEMASAGYEEMRGLEREVAGLGDRLETRKLVERAKASCSSAWTHRSRRPSGSSRRPRWTGA